MSIIESYKKNGMKHSIEVFYQYKIDLIIQKFMFLFLKYKPLENIIMIESHNDFDSNGGAFYEYLIKNGYNKKYKIVWLLKHDIPENLPDNVECVPLFKPSIKKDYYICMAKYFTADNNVTHKLRHEQKSFFLTHASFGLKNIKDKGKMPESVDYVLMQSESYAPIQAKQYSMPYPDARIVFLGYPTHDVLLSSDMSELNKVTSKKYKKVIIWMPTFRKGGGFNRNDSDIEQKLGIPLIDTIEQYETLNDYLKKLDMLMIIKIHPMQDLSNLKIKDRTNIKVLTGESVKKLGIDNYRLMKCADAMISDFSSSVYEYLQINRPVAYVLSDLNNYKLGFIVDDIHKFMVGKEIFVMDDLKEFIQDVADGNDIYEDKRIALRDYIYKYHDTNSCKRLADFMGLTR